ncbi:ATP-binding protein [Bacteroidales bacterium OttesenSCG-928-I14]|nr:ATP-binding protein [Bacteroidales bacterium OttesenSCG-928-I14]
MNSEKLDIKRHTFQHGAMSIIQMGEELIGHPSTAINELVKNGYDADALNCNVYFHYDSDKEAAFIIIYDNGSGMDDETLFGDWLKPSFSTKRKMGAKSSLFKRSLLGSKGIGRLAAMALGERVTVVSKREEEKIYNWITVNREDFREEVLLSEINFPGDQILYFCDLFENNDYIKIRNGSNNITLTGILHNNNFDSFQKGTLIIIESIDDAVLKILRDDYSQIEDLDQKIESYKNTQFYKSLATLVTPLNLNKDIQTELFEKKIITSPKVISNDNSDFLVEYSTNLLPDTKNCKIEWLKVESIPIQSAYDYRIYGRVSSEGEVDGFISYNRLETDIFEEKFNFQTIENFKESSAQKNLFDNFIGFNTQTGEYYFDIRVYDIGEKDNLEKLAKKAKFKNTSTFREAFKKFQGLRISKNGFGVKPYGEEVEDWIGLSKARVQNPGQNVNTNQILGYIFFFSPENDSLEEKTNREGFLENEAFQQVKDSLKSIFSNLGRKRYNYRLKHGIGRNPASKHQRPNFEEFYSALYAQNVNPKIINLFQKFTTEVSTSLDNLEESLSFSERLASLGSGIELIYHEMAQPISRLRNTETSLQLKKKSIEISVQDNFLRDIHALHSATDALNELRQALQPAIGRTRKKNFKPYNTFIKVCNLYKSDIDENNIKIRIENKLANYELFGLEYAFWISFLNIINNAVYWLKKTDGFREIFLCIEDEAIVIGNTGPNISENVLDLIFDYGVTTRIEKNATGLGLAFTQSVLSRTSWSIFAENRAQGPVFIIKKEKDE